MVLGGTVGLTTKSNDSDSKMSIGWED